MGCSANLSAFSKPLDWSKASEQKYKVISIEDCSHVYENKLVFFKEITCEKVEAQNTQSVRIFKENAAKAG